MTGTRGLLLCIAALLAGALLLLLGGRGEPIAQGTGLLALAAVAGLLATRGIGRRIVGAVVVFVAIIAIVQGESTAVRLGGVAVSVAGGMACWFGPSWRRMSDRYDAADATGGEPTDMWAALDRGEDPTQGRQ